MKPFITLSRNDAVRMGSAPASGAADRALAVCESRPTSRTVWFGRMRSCSARGRAEQQPGRLRSPCSTTASFRLRRANAGFTMVEIAIALGVIGFALVAIIGILPAGLEVQRDNRSETIINQDATFWMDAIRSGAQGMDDLTNWVDQIYTPEDAAPFQFANGGLGGGRFSSGADIIALLTTALRFGDTNVQAIVTAFSGSAAEKDLDKNSRELSFKYRLSVAITNAAPLVVGFDELNPEDPPRPKPLQTLYEVRLTLSYPYTGKGSEPRRKTYRVTASRNVLTNLVAGREFYLFTP